MVAAQKSAPAQDTWFSSPPAVPGGSGTGWAVKTPPSWLRRANAVPVPMSSPFPSVASLAPTSVQPVPWQDSPKGMSWARSLIGFGKRKPPVAPRDAVHQASSSPWFSKTRTAEQTRGLRHETSRNETVPGMACAGLATVDVVQVASLRSATSSRELLTPAEPTAVQAVPVAHDTPFRLVPRGAFGMDCVLHRWPFQCSTSGCSGLSNLSRASPTA